MYFIIYVDDLDKILKSSKKPVFVFYGHANEQEWSQVLAEESTNGGINSKDEMKSVKAFLDEHKGITGLILNGFEYNVRIYLLLIFKLISVQILFVGNSNREI